MSTAIATQLTEQQRELVKLIVGEGRPPEEAAELAGYHPKSVYRTLRLPAVAAAVSESTSLTWRRSVRRSRIASPRAC